jgi:hypothetical protein
MLALLVFVQVLYVCLVYGPIAAYWIEAFPAKVRYTSVSLPYHIGNDVFGGLLPLIGLWSCATTGNIYASLYYPMIMASMTFVVGSRLLRETYGHRIWDQVGGKASRVVPGFANFCWKKKRPPLGRPWGFWFLFVKEWIRSRIPKPQAGALGCTSNSYCAEPILAAWWSAGTGPAKACIREPLARIR